MSNRRCSLSRIAALAILVVVSSVAVAADEPDALQRVRERGTLDVALYKNFPPFSYRDEKGRVVGIDADIAGALAERIGVTAVIRMVGADESMEDDLRNNVWKGHYLGGGVADLMLHVPQDEAFAEDNDRVLFVAPYYREAIVVAYGPGSGPGDMNLQLFTREKVGVELDTLADFFLLSAYNGRIREQVVHFRSVGEAVAALKRGELAGVVGPRSEVEYALGQAREGFRVRPIQTRGLRGSEWDLGAAVKQGNEHLATAISESMKALREAGSIQEIFARNDSTYIRPLRADPLERGSGSLAASRN
jgi:ABC-type amino acid transport substrate-binding protein